MHSATGSMLKSYTKYDIIATTVDGRSFVYVLGDDGLRHMVDVEIGLSTGSQTEIVSGLNEGDEIILA